MATSPFRKRFYTPRAFAHDFAAAVRRIPRLRRARREGGLNRELSEKIMLVVTAVNGCRYCSYFHSLLALRSGIESSELEQLLALDIGHFPPQEAVALAFAQHYAESGGRPDAAALARLRGHYGTAAADQVLDYIGMITMGNLAGNTVDAFLSRLRGAPAPGSSALGELALFLLFAPFTLPLLPRLHRRA